MLSIDIGDKSANGSNFVPVAIQPGQTVTVFNIAGDTLNYLTNFDGAATTTTVGNNVAFTLSPVWLQSQGRTSVQITGGCY